MKRRLLFDSTHPAMEPSFYAPTRRRTFSLCVLVFIAIALIVVFLSETLGLWLVTRKVDAADRLDAARVIFQFSIVSFFFMIIMTPFQAMVIIKEKMKVYTYISFFEAFGNLAIAIAISRTGHDRLIMYGFLMMLVNVAVSLYYISYCNAFWKECRFRFYWNRARFMEIFSFAGWNMVGSLSNTCKNQGITVLINMAKFGNVIVSANVMANKLYQSVQRFSENFMIALKPQMIKSYATGDREGMFKLLFQGSKFSYFLMFMISLPLLLETGPILNIWLKDVPDYTCLFVRLLLINALVEVFASPLATPPAVTTAHQSHTLARHHSTALRPGRLATMAAMHASSLHTAILSGTRAGHHRNRSSTSATSG